MYPLISTWTILPGNENKALSALKQLAVKVRDTEPGTLAYLVHTPDFSQGSLPTPPGGQVVFFEIYKDANAFQAHLNGPSFTGFVNAYGGLFLQNYNHLYVTVGFMEHKAGFIRDVLV